ncbi:MAG TPA: hypothetical protein VEV43_03195 [Actinomycetota bacterium]|nr:hypothetical protein [Actinomycetota bacterium]
MHRSATRTLTVVALTGLLAAASLPAQAKSRHKEHRGKKAMGEIVSFDEATMTLEVDLPGDEDFSGAVDPDARVKLDHRGWNKRGGSHGNPTEGSLDDLLPGAAVLRMKVEDDLVTKIRIRPIAEAPLPPAEDGDDEDALPGDETPADDTPGDDSTDDSEDDSDDDSDDEDADTNPDDEDLGDPEDALPPLPVPQP